MKYPKLINTLLYKKITKNTYCVKNSATDDEFELGINIVKLMNCLDGKTDPLTVNSCLSDCEINDIIDWLWDNNLITKSKFEKVGFLTYGIALFKIKASQKSKIISRILNMMLMINFLPIFIIGLFFAKDLYYTVDEGTWLYVIGIYIGIFGGVILHECGHAVAALAYNAHLFDCGIMIGIMSGAFVEIDDEHLTSLLKRAQIGAAGIEMNLLISGFSMIFMYLFKPLISLFAGIAMINLLLALINLLPIIGADGLRIVSRLIGNDFILYSDSLLKDKSFVKDSLSEGITGFAKLFACVLTMLSQFAYPILLIASFLYIWRILV